jgi:hypothetical protein
MGASSGGSAQGAASQSQAPQAPQNTMSTVDFAKQFAPMATSLADFQKTNHYTPQDYIQAYVNGSQPTKAFAGTATTQPNYSRGFQSNQGYQGMGGMQNANGTSLLDLMSNNKLGGN